MSYVIGIAGIHTGIGKTIASAVLASALQADYWKPVQAGDLENSDSKIVKRLLSDGATKVHPEAMVLSQPLSPHAAAQIDNVVIDFKQFQLPHSSNSLLIETAGGLLSPMTETATMADFIKHFDLPVLLVTGNYLGSISHTLLSIEVLKSRHIPIIGIVVNGETNMSSESFIESYGKVPVIARIPFFENLCSDNVRQCADSVRASLLQKINNGKY